MKLALGPLLYYWPRQAVLGFYEAIDYTPARLRRAETRAVVRSFMAHHQGMILLSLSHVLLGRPMQRRFESDPLFQATLLLLQERFAASAQTRGGSSPSKYST